MTAPAPRTPLAARLERAAGPGRGLDGDPERVSVAMLALCGKGGRS